MITMIRLKIITMIYLMITFNSVFNIIELIRRYEEKTQIDEKKKLLLKIQKAEKAKKTARKKISSNVLFVLFIIFLIIMFIVSLLGDKDRQGYEEGRYNFIENINTS